MIKLYYDLMSPPSRALLTLLKAVKLPFEEKPVALRNRKFDHRPVAPDRTNECACHPVKFTGEHLTEQFAKEVSQFRRVPVIHDGDFILTESSAILRYVRRKYPDLFTDYWYPADVKAQARVDEYMSWAHNGIRMVVGLAFFTKFRDPLLNGIPADPALVRAVVRRSVIERFLSTHFRFTGETVRYQCPEDVE